MEGKVVVVCCIVGILGLLSAALGFAAEATKIKDSDVEELAPDVCKYPKSPAFSLGLVAALSLMLAHLFINTFAGCMCCDKRSLQLSDTNWSTALFSFIFSWITFIIAFLLLLMGAGLNSQNNEQTMYCYVIQPGVFSGSAVLSLASVILGIIYYIHISSSKNTSPQLWGPTPQNEGITLGEPQIPPRSDQPVFVHENTYNRQQVP